jgi:hypothetical protein
MLLMLVVLFVVIIVLFVCCFSSNQTNRCRSCCFQFSRSFFPARSSNGLSIGREIRLCLSEPSFIVLLSVLGVGYGMFVGLWSTMQANTTNKKTTSPLFIVLYNRSLLFQLLLLPGSAFLLLAAAVWARPSREPSSTSGASIARSFPSED